MVPGRSTLWFKGVHNVLGLGSAFFVVLLVLTGVALNHPSAWIPGSDREVHCVAADPAVPGRLLRGSSVSLESSEDGGKSWRDVPMAVAPLDVTALAFDPGNPRRRAALQRWQGPLFSEDGVVWEAPPLPFDPLDEGVEMRSVSFDRAGSLWLHTSQGTLRRAAGGGWEPVDFDLQRKNWGRILRTLHNGHFFGPWFVKVYDGAGAALLLLIVTGVLLWRARSS